MSILPQRMGFVFVFYEFIIIYYSCLNVVSNYLHTIHQMNVFQKALTRSVYNIHDNIE
jgi:hypothetical protein